jgi:microfibrillar-associated protein 1
VDILKRHDFTEATESTLDVTILPKVMQKRDFGKRSQTKYTHLVDQDTTDRQSLFKDTGPKGKYGQPGGGIVCFICGGPHLKRGPSSLQSHQPMPMFGSRLPTIHTGNGSVFESA